MDVLINTEFYTTPDGEVMIKIQDSPVRKFEESDRMFVENLFILIRDRYAEAFNALSELYSRSERNRVHFEYKIVHRFIRCNLGEYDQHKYDIDRNGLFQFEEVRCPLRGECRYECVICKPKLNTVLTTRELEVSKLIADGLQAGDIAEELSLSVATINRHRENIKAKLQLKTITQIGVYYNENFK